MGIILKKNLVLKKEEVRDVPPPISFEELRAKADPNFKQKANISQPEKKIVDTQKSRKVGELGIIEYKKSSFLDDMLLNDKE